MRLCNRATSEIEVFAWRNVGIVKCSSQGQQQQQQQRVVEVRTYGILYEFGLSDCIYRRQVLC